MICPHYKDISVYNCKDCDEGLPSPEMQEELSSLRAARNAMERDMHSALLQRDRAVALLRDIVSHFEWAEDDVGASLLARANEIIGTPCGARCPKAPHVICAEQRGHTGHHSDKRGFTSAKWE